MKNSTKNIAINGLVIALVFVATRFTSFPGPVPPGYINLGDIVILAAAMLFGGRTGFIAGAIGSALADVSYGAMLYVPITFVVKGIEGYIVGYFGPFGKGKQFSNFKNVMTIFSGAVIMIAGYFLSEAFILGLFDSNFGISAAIANLPMNLIQGSVSVLGAYLLYIVLKDRIKV